MKQKINRWLECHSSRQLLCLSMALAAAISVFDRGVRIDLSLSVFYLVPIAIASWYINRRSGIVLSVLCSLAWLWADTAGKQAAISFLPIWNAGIRLSFFAIVSYLISLQKRAYQKERRLARTDGLTGIHNRRFFREILRLEIERSRRYKTSFALAYLDIDNFKAINDSLGHQEGDRLLKNLAYQLRKTLRANDTVGRLGGDEFAILLAQIDPAKVHHSLKRVQAQLQSSIGSCWPVSFSIGVVVFAESPVSVGVAIAQADRVMYDIKKSGKNRLELQMAQAVSTQSAMRQSL